MACKKTFPGLRPFHLIPFLLLISVSIKGGLTQNLDPINDNCARWHHQSAIKNGYLYIDGGTELYHDPSGKDSTILGNNQRTIYVDMTDSWDWKTNITVRGIQKTSESSSGTPVPSLSRAAFFAGPSNATEMLVYGGSYFLGNSSFPGLLGMDPEVYSLWGFDSSGHSWKKYDVSLAAQHRPNYGAWAEATELGYAFYLHGRLDRGSGYGVPVQGNETLGLGGLVVLDTYHKTARNMSAEILGQARVGGGLQYLEGVGDSGALLALGGLVVNGNSREDVSKGTVTFDTVHVCDDWQGNCTWRAQNTSGKIPLPRIDFCLTTATAPDNSSYNVYLYGGLDPVKNKAYDDVWVLSLPSFTWIPIYERDSPRWGHTCHLVGNRQMLTVGGVESTQAWNIETNGVPVNRSGIWCDWEEKGVAIYDLTELRWGSVYSAYDAKYQVPNLIYAEVGGDKDGGATKTAPDSGFAEAAIQTMFAKKPTPTPKPEGTETAKPNKSKGTSAGQIAGAVVGPVVGLALIVVAVGYSIRRARKQRQGLLANGQANKPPLYEAGDTHIQEMGEDSVVPKRPQPVAHTQVRQLAPAELEGVV